MYSITVSLRSNAFKSCTVSMRSCTGSSARLEFAMRAALNGCAVLCPPGCLQMEERRDSMLETAKLCFTSAARCEGDGDEEEWLIHYMLGKIAEKQKQPPVVYLLHYKQAGHYLHEEAARYPKKIHYHNPPELAMEALEVKVKCLSSKLCSLQSVRHM